MSPTLSPLNILPELPQDTWNLLFDWMPGVGPCSGQTCEIPNRGAAFYILLIFLIAIGIREAYLRVTGAREDTTEIPLDEEELEDSDSSESTEEESPMDGSPADDEINDDNSSDGGFGSGSSVRSLVPWGGKVEEENNTISLRDDPRVDQEKLHVTAEFDDLLEEETKEEIIEDEKTIEEVTTDDLAEDAPPFVEEDDFDPEEFFCKVERLHQRQIAPSEAEKADTHYRLGNQYARVLIAHDFPDQIKIGRLKSIIEDPSLHFDLTIHFHHLNQSKTRRSAKNLYNNLEASASNVGDSFAVGDKIKRGQKVRAFYDEMKKRKQRAFELTMYVCIRDDDKERLGEKVDEVRSEFATEADIDLKTMERHQKEGLQSASPLGTDPVHNEVPDVDPTHIGLGESFGAIVSSLTQSKKFEPSGHEWGVHSVQGHPIVKDPFESAKNYNTVVVGESGTGKSLNTKKMALETKAVRPETLIIILDPLQGFYGLAEALDAKKINIGSSKQPLNPMDIRRPPEEYINSEAFDEGEDPLGAKFDDVMAFLQNFVAQLPGDIEFGEESQLLREFVMAAYKQKGITHDVRTHDCESPTLRDVYKFAEEARKNPEKWAREAESPEDIKKHAEKIGQLLRGFCEGGRYSHLSERTDEDVFGDNDVIYLDLHQQESSGGDSTGVMGQLMFSMAYELCKQHPGPCLYIIDEARFLFQDADTLDYLAQRVRHSRHYDTSIRFITQEMDDFFDFGVAEGIVHNASYKIIHQSADVDDWGDHFDLNEQHKRFVKNAATGKDVPYSQALVQFPDTDQWYPLTIDIGERMLAVADFDEHKDHYEDLPGKGKEAIDLTPIERELITRIRNGVTEHETQLDNILEDWEEPMWEILSEERAEKVLQRITEGQHPRKALYTETLEQIRWVIDHAGGDDISTEVVDRLKEAIADQYSETYQAPSYEQAQKMINQGRFNVEKMETVPDDDQGDADSEGEEGADEDDSAREQGDDKAEQPEEEVAAGAGDD